MRSMTAYASAQKSRGTQTIKVILRSLNFKYQDICIHNLPAEDILLEEKIKRVIKRKVHRGKIEVFIFSARPQIKKVCVDKEAVNGYITQMKALCKQYNLKADINISNVLGLPQAIFWGQRNTSDKTLVLSTVEEAVGRLLKFKEKEGEAIKKEMKANLSKLRSNIERIKKQKPKASEMENGKEDIDEELSLAEFYISKLFSKFSFKKPGLQGKSIDFLTQEILRELNSASSKTKKKAPALLIVESKNYLERIREQAQNIE